LLIDDKTTGSDIRMYYQQKNKEAIIHSFFSKITSVEKNIWSFDGKEHTKSHAFHITRTGLSAEKDFYNILTDKKCNRLSNFEKSLNLIYAPEGEMTSFLLGWLLRLYEETAGEQFEKWKCLNSNVEIKISFDIKTPIIQSISDRLSTSRKLLQFLGLVKNSTSLIVTEKWLRTLEWLIMIIGDYLMEYIPNSNSSDYQGYSNCFKSTHEENWLLFKNKEDLPKKLETLKSYYLYYKNTSDVVIRQNDFNFITELLTSQKENASTFYRRARFTLPGHLILRERDLSSRAWLVFRIYDYSFHENESKNNDVGFCLITFKDSDANGNTFNPNKLIELIKKIRLIFQLIAHAENNGFFVRKIIEKESSKNRLISGIERVVHIFNTKIALLSGVKNKIFLLSTSSKNKDELQQGIKAKADELHERIEFLKTESGILKEKLKTMSNPMNLLETEVNIFIRECISALGNDDPRIDIQPEDEDNSGKVICYIDRNKIELAIATLIENSVKKIKKTLDETNHGKVRIACSYSPNKRYCQIRISDTGGGISPEVKKRIDNNLPIKRADGFGLGLFIVKEIIDQHRGNLNIGNSDDGAIIMMNLSNTMKG